MEEAEQRREEKRRQGIFHPINLFAYKIHNCKFSDLDRLIRAQQRKVSKVLLDGLYDSDSPISKLLGVHTEVMGEIIWQKMLANNWQIFPAGQ